jgi:7-cyano-7-deazaguanine reductase
MDKLSILGSKVSYEETYSTKQLERIDRESRRKGYVEMFGGDIWTVFEFSFLLPNKLPQYYILRIFNPVNSKYIFESKGLKLYLNSFNNTIFLNLDIAIKTIIKDLSELTGTVVEVKPIQQFLNNSLYDNAIFLEDQFNQEIDTYSYSPNLLEVLDIPTKGFCEVRSNLLRSNCEITNQPDFAHIYIKYEGERSITNNSLLKYLISYRKHQEFHEPTCERIYQDLFKLLKPKHLTVICQYTRRGGIDINPIRSSHFLDIKYLDLPKLIQQ